MDSSPQSNLELAFANGLVAVTIQLLHVFPAEKELLLSDIVKRNDLDCGKRRRSLFMTGLTVIPDQVYVLAELFTHMVHSGNSV